MLGFDPLASRPLASGLPGPVLPPGFSAFFDLGSAPRSAANQPFDAAWRFPVSATPAAPPQGSGSASRLFSERFTSPFPAAAQQWDGFSQAAPPPSNPVPHGWESATGNFPEQFTRPFNAAQQQRFMYRSRAIASASPQGFAAFFDPGRKPPSAASMPFDAALDLSAPSTTPRGFAAFFDTGKAPPSAANMPFDAAWRFVVALPPAPEQGWESALWMFPDRFAKPFPVQAQPWDACTARGKIASVTPQGFTSFFDPGRKPPSAAQQKYEPFFSFRALPIRAFGFGTILA